MLNWPSDHILLWGVNGVSVVSGLKEKKVSMDEMGDSYGANQKKKICTSKVLVVQWYFFYFYLSLILLLEQCNNFLFSCMFNSDFKETNSDAPYTHTLSVSPSYINTHTVIWCVLISSCWKLIFWQKSYIPVKHLLLWWIIQCALSNNKMFVFGVLSYC